MAYNKVSIFSSFVLLLSFLLLICSGERHAKQSTLVCNTIYGTRVGDTCSSIIEAFQLTATSFGAINPNLNCNKVFVGEWLCIDGSIE
ncbi:Peptidoglycan-binding lysin domain-containing protein [Cynara cardunculus var. scolymus]|uniref:Peptidoglycan-binding lysin domain-containing protein n=1 Tax=Cynara cardunculus var. scolymus TaxID=59895 RepID=A0A103XTK0_CYNCS|nr:Peptidoglycan-binding lysin domain-containing protein [Cynara cardunculus var. scolymus]